MNNCKFKYYKGILGKNKLSKIPFLMLELIIITKMCYLFKEKQIWLRLVIDFW